MCHPIELSQHHIDVSIQLENCPVWWHFTGLYGEPDTNQRELTWNLLTQLHSQCCRAWLCVGDFNQILDQSEKRVGPPRPNWQIQNFRKALENCELVDLGYSGTPLTWCNRHSKPNTIQEHLDRACANLEWSQLFPDTSVRHIPMHSSDHGALSAVRPSSRDGLRQLSEWVKRRTKFLEDKVGHLLWFRLTLKVSKDIVETRKELERLAAHEETIWKHHSKVLWLREGDRNTGFFYRWVSTCFQTNLIKKLKNSERALVTMEEGIQGFILVHFCNVYASSRPLPDAIAKGIEHLRAGVDFSTAEELLQPYTTLEVKQALFQMAHLKSPEPDESFSGLQNRGERGWMALKLDVSKAYDKFEWSFLEQVMSKLESLVPYYRMQNVRGVFEVLRSVGGLCLFPISYLQMIRSFLAKLAPKNSQAIREVLETYRGLLGQEINFSKTSVGFSRNTKEDLCQHLAVELTIGGNKMELYLGLPSRIACSKRDLFTTIWDRIWQKITGWNEKLLSQVGKENSY
ncbi:UNVERIFIED_CONTAM: hypothetical protein Scaly_2769400 [Sesamum calycinum]|uniref:Reverse transcriptase n=1 Tax=Sesamum calycinum TaxID=2727403 RepID=A0AAW2IYN9_9LAMI